MFDVIVIGGGHAGTEAAAAASRAGASTALVTFAASTIGAMSCNPAIGGLGKGNIVREIDAFDGVMAVASDRAAIHYRMLNRSKGAAVQGPRVQADRRRYAVAVQAILAGMPNLTLIEGEAEALMLAQERVTGIKLADGSLVRGRSVVLATGTFLGATLFRGDERYEGGRISERPATVLAAQLRGFDLATERLKTGTPPRLDGRTIDWTRLEEQPSDGETWTMSSMGGRHLPTVSCAIARTNSTTHDIIRAGLDRSPLHTGAIEAAGPRYCPSIEDKISRFGDRDGHQIFLEPEGLDDPIVYPNGLSTSLPADVQHEMIRSVAGLERADIVVPGYAVEYDYIDPRGLDARLAVRALPGLFCAGQINGTTGYEEAAGQGLVAGLNAAAEALGRNPIVLDRATSYIGVMIDDLTLQGVTEPYRMLTARAEFRLSLRADNAETRLASIAQVAGCVGKARLAHQRRNFDKRTALREKLDVEITASMLAKKGVAVAQDGARRTAFEWLRFPHISIDDVIDDREQRDDHIAAEVTEDARYAPYLERQAEEIIKMRRDEAIALPSALRFEDIAGLSNEMLDRLKRARPTTLAAAARIRGITPAALTAIYLHTQRKAA